RRSRPLSDEEREEADLLEALVKRTEGSRTETLGLVAIMRRSRASLMAGAVSDAGEVARTPTRGPDPARPDAVPAAEPVSGPPAGTDPAAGPAATAAITGSGTDTDADA